jgi:hypothetical protein
MSSENQLFLHLVGQILNTECFTSSGRDFFVLPRARKSAQKAVLPTIGLPRQRETRTSALSINSACVLNYLETLTHTHIDEK